MKFAKRFGESLRLGADGRGNIRCADGLKGIKNGYHEVAIGVNNTKHLIDVFLSQQYKFFNAVQDLINIQNVDFFFF